MQNAQHQPLSVSQLALKVGQQLGLSSWKTISQARIDGFAELTEDRQFIHVDPARAKRETQFGGTIAHGFLSLSLLSAFAEEALPQVSETLMTLNYGFDKVRFLNPVPSGARVRARFILGDMSYDGGVKARISYRITIEIENIEKPALVAEWLVLYQLAEAVTDSAVAAG